MNDIINEVMINLNHPCYEVDIIKAVNKEQRRDLRGQGYIELNKLRLIALLLNHYDALIGNAYR